MPLPLPPSQVVAPRYFDSPTLDSLQWVAAQVADWPPPTPGLMCSLAAGDTLIRTQLPLNSTLPPPARDEEDDNIRYPSSSGVHDSELPSTSDAATALADDGEVPHSPFDEAHLYGIFRSYLPKLWTLWELMLLGEPLMGASNPSAVGTLPEAACSLTSPTGWFVRSDRADAHGDQ